MRHSIRPRASLALLVAVIGSVLGASTANAGTITVSTFGDQYGTGSACSLREAIHAAHHDEAFGGCPSGAGLDTIRLAQGTYELGEAGLDETGVNGDLDIHSDLRIRGAGAGKTTIDGNALDRVFDVDPTGLGGVDVTIAKLTVRGGRTGGNGGGIRNGGNLRLDGVAVTSNEAVADGGAIDNDATLVATMARIVGNRAGDEAGAIENSGALTLGTTTIRGNTAGGDSGAINAFGGSVVTIRRSLLEGNVAGSNGSAGIELGAGTLTIEDSTLTGNRTSGNGGAIRTLGGTTATVLRSTIVNNVAGAASGGGIHASGAVQVTASIVSANAPANCLAPAPSGGANIDSGSSCAFAAAGDLSNTNPQLRPIGNYGGPTRTHALRSNSPAINSAGGCGGVDQRGVPRPFGSACDRGAYERATCAGVVVNRVGTPSADILEGTSKADGFLGLAGNDRLRGRKGNDGLCGGKGKDRLAGGPGRDRLRGGQGTDLCIGGPGTDRAATCEERRSIG